MLHSEVREQIANGDVLQTEGVKCLMVIEAMERRGVQLFPSRSIWRAGITWIRFRSPTLKSSARKWSPEIWPGRGATTPPPGSSSPRSDFSPSGLSMHSGSRPNSTATAGSVPGSRPRRYGRAAGFRLNRTVCLRNSRRLDTFPCLAASSGGASSSLIWRSWFHE
jgi:hypothetical protein